MKATAWIDNGPASLDDDERRKARKRQKLVRRKRGRALH